MEALQKFSRLYQPFSVGENEISDRLIAFSVSPAEVQRDAIPLAVSRGRALVRVQRRILWAGVQRAANSSARGTGAKRSVQVKGGSLCPGNLMPASDYTGL